MSSPRLAAATLAARHPGITASAGVFASALLAFLAIGAALPVLPGYVRGSLHAGDVVRLPGDRIEAFYAQNWAFARFLWEYDNGRYRPAFKKLLADTAAGSAYDPSGTLHRATNMWSPSGVRPMLEHYLGKDLAQIETEYQQFIRKIAYEQFGKQWGSQAG